MTTDPDPDPEGDTAGHHLPVPSDSAAASLPELAPLLGRAKQVMERIWQKSVADGLAGPDACVLFFASSSGAERAIVFTARGGNFAEAWESGAAELHARWHRRGLKPRWLRVEAACSVQVTTWGDICKQLAATKRNYWRRCIAFDADLETALLAQECAGAALLYDSKQPVATPNSNNLRVYARRRFQRDLAWPDDPSQPMWLFDTRAVFTDGEGVEEIEHAGRNRGYRRIKDWGPEVDLDVIRRSTGYLARQVKAEGRYEYGCFPCFDRAIPTYNALRHASSTYALLEGWELTGDPGHEAAACRALDHLCKDLIREADLLDGTRAAFLVDTGNEVKLGGNGVCLLALSKYTELTGDRRYLPLLEKLALGVLHMQDASSGSFVHVLHWPSLQVKNEHRIIYYDGEAAFGLMRLYGLTRDARWLSAVEKAFEHFIAAEHWRAHDHWLSYCVNELTLYRSDPRYYQFGLDNVRDHLDFVRTRITTFPTLLELMMAARKMIDRIKSDPEHAHLLDGFDLDKFQDALEWRARYLLSGFFWPEVAMFFRNPERILDGFFIRHHGFRVRIDDVEHYLSGYVAYWKWLTSPVGNVSRPVATRAPCDEESHFPADLQGQKNGELDDLLLQPIIGGWLHWRAAQAWAAMRAAALADGVLLEPTCYHDTYRPLAIQERVFLAHYQDQPVAGAEPVAWQEKHWWLKPGRASVMVPGSSRHGLGLAVDIHGSGNPARMDWLKANAPRFGWRWTVPSESWHIEYLAGDVPPTAVVDHLGTLARANDRRPHGWTKEAVRIATGGTWLRAPLAPDWIATGLCIWAPSMAPGQLVVSRFDEQPLGLKPAVLATLRDPPGGVIMEDDRQAEVAERLPVLRVENRKQAVLRLGAYARSQMSGKVLAVTGSSGKTTTVGMLADVLEGYGPTNRTQHNANLPPGVAWNLASMDWRAPFTVLELAIGRMGESARMTQPDVALVINVGEAHLRYHGNVDEIARRKARIFSGMLPGSLAVLNRDLPQWRIFASQAARFGLRTISFGRSAGAQARFLDHSPATGEVHARILGQEVRYVLGVAGEHMAINSLACLAAVAGMGLPLEKALSRLAHAAALPGRGEILNLEVEGKPLRIIDDAYNANPISMAAALRLIRDTEPPLPEGRRVLVLGDMRELEPRAEELHAALASEVGAAQPDLLLLCGEYMSHLQEAMAGEAPSHWFPDVEALQVRLLEFLEPGDLVLVKSSAGTRLSELVRYLQQLHAPSVTPMER
ncbi:Mur ligase family protein [Luteimonas sp. A277]